MRVTSSLLRCGVYRDELIQGPVGLLPGQIEIRLDTVSSRLVAAHKAAGRCGDVAGRNTGSV